MSGVGECDFCEGTKDIYWKCNFCSANLCRKCKLIHQSRSAFNDHKVILRKPFSEKGFRRIHSIDVERIGRKVSCIKHLQSSELWLQHEKQLTLVNKNGDVIKQFTFDFSPHGFVISRSGELFVGDIVENIVWKVLKCGDIVPFIQTNKNSPWGICLNTKEEIVICLKTSVAIYSPDGRTLIHEIKSENDKGEKVFHWAYNVVQSGNLDYYVWDWATCSVVTFDATFSFKWRYESEEKDSPEPLDICCDRYDHLIIAYYTGCIVLLDSVGTVVSRIENNARGFLQCISADEEGILWNWQQGGAIVVLFTN